VGELTPASVYDTVTGLLPTLAPSMSQQAAAEERRACDSDSQETLDDIDDSVYDTLTEPPCSPPACVAAETETSAV